MLKFIPLYFVCLLLEPMSLKAQTSSSIHKYKLYGETQEMPKAVFVLPTFNNSVLIFGRSYTDPVIVKADSAGNVLWGKSYQLQTTSTKPGDFIYATQNQDSTIIALGITYTSFTSSPQGFIIKLKNNGDLLWCKTLNDNDYALIPQAVTMTYDSAYINCGVAVLTTTTSGLIRKAYVAKVNKHGALLWFKYLTQSFRWTAANQIQLTADSGFVIAGSMAYSSNPTSCVLVFKLNKDGSLNWGKRYYDLSTNSCGFDVVSEKNGYQVLATFAYPTLFKCNSNGTVLWQKSYAELKGLNNGIYTRELRLRRISMSRNLLTNTPYDFLESWAMVTDSLGNPLFRMEFNGICNDVIENKNKQFYMSVNMPNSVVVKSSGLKLEGMGLVITDTLGVNTSTCFIQDSVALTTNPVYEESLACAFSGSATFSNSTPQITLLNLTTETGCYDIYAGIKESQSDWITVFADNIHGGLIIKKTNSSAFHNIDLKLYDIAGKIILERNLDLINLETFVPLKNDAGVFTYRIKHRQNPLPVKFGKFVYSP